MVWAGPAEDQHLSVIWASPVPGTSTNQHLTVSVATYLIFYQTLVRVKSYLRGTIYETRKAEQSDDTQGTHRKT